MPDSTADTATTVLVLNPRSGSAEHSQGIRDRAATRGYDIVETERANHAVELARTAASDGADVVVAVGGDGTLNEVVCGVDAADRLSEVTVGVIPAGTGNAFADSVGVTDLDDGFRTVADGRRRRIDVGMAGDRPFVNTCLAGLTADASEATSADLKSRYGVLAYVVQTAQAAQEFTGVELTATTPGADGRELVWEGEAVLVLVGNASQFTPAGTRQADVEDGCFDVTIVEDADSVSLVGNQILDQLADGGSAHTTRFQAPSLELRVGGDVPISFSLDGEIVQARSLELTTRPRSLRVAVGEGYDPTPAGD